MVEDTTKKNAEMAGPAGTSAAKAASQNKPLNQEKTEPRTGFEREFENVTQRGSEIIENAKQSFTEAYDKTGKALGATYERAIEYGSEHPGTMTIVAFGVGVGLGYILAQNTRLSSRSRAQRVVPPVMNALSQVVTELFD